MPAVQPFSAVQVSVADIAAEDLQMEIENLMFEYEQAKVHETEAYNAVVLANAALLSARGSRAVARMKLVTAFAKGSDRVAMEPNWEPFRNSNGRPAVENFLSERDQRNLNRMQRAQMNSQASDIQGSYNGMFEAPDGN
jgi:hypothetical protein